MTAFPEIQRIQDQLRRAIAGGAWHGPALLEVVGRLTAEQAGRHPLRAVHSPWEILSHVVAWLHAVRRRLDGDPADLTAAEDWPPVDEGDDAAWDALRARVSEAHEHLQAAIGRLDVADLEAPVPGQRYDVYFLLHGVIQHTLYHAGQLAILEKAVRACPSDR